MQQEKTFQYVIQAKSGLLFSGCYIDHVPEFVTRESGEFWRYASLPSACEDVLELILHKDKFDAEQIYEAQILREEVR